MHKLDTLFDINMMDRVDKSFNIGLFMNFDNELTFENQENIEKWFLQNCESERLHMWAHGTGDLY